MGMMRLGRDETSRIIAEDDEVSAVLVEERRIDHRGVEVGDVTHRGAFGQRRPRRGRSLEVSIAGAAAFEALVGTQVQIMAHNRQSEAFRG